MCPASTASPSTPFSAHKKLAAAALLWLLTFAVPGAAAQHYSVIHNFTGGSDGANPLAGVTLDRGGNLYGTTTYGGSHLCLSFGYVGCGTTFKLSHRGASWLFATLHNFTGSPDGANPVARIVFGPDGALYGTTSVGGELGAGSIFQLRPPNNACPTVSCPWTETQIYNGFDGQYGGGYPGGGDLIFDSHGNIYGTTMGGGGYECNDGTCGTVWELTPAQGSWTIHYYDSGFNGLASSPYAGLLQVDASTFYGTAPSFGGGIFNFNGSSGTVVYYFPYGSSPVGGLIKDASANLYGTTSQGGVNGVGSVFQYNPSSNTLTTLFSFSGTAQEQEPGPTATLLMDSAGNLYGTTHIDGAFQEGSVFKLSQSGGNWTLTTLHDFTGGADGGKPFGQLTMDANGNIFGTAQIGGSSVGSCYQQLGCGVVFEITP